MIKFTIRDGNLFIDKNLLEFKDIVFLEELGYGANAHVFLIYNKVLERKEALKIWTPRIGKNVVDKKRFLSEVRKNSKFFHENIATIYEANTIEEHYYCRMQYVRGITLKSYLDDERDFVIRYIYLEKILRILSDVYDAGYFHGDIHEKNIMINTQMDEVFLIDFGTSVFSGVEQSHKRDANLLYKLCYKLVPELEKICFIKSSIVERGSQVIKDVMLHVLPVLWSLETLNIKDADSYTLIEQLILPLEIIICEYNFIDINYISDFLKSINLNSNIIKEIKMFHTDINLVSKL
ncbi:protein kinase domain-containing protein [Maledivibacter halophilus]|uniref:Protein kinase domain-containing protein n=1 Tax=Maledivibacter halophilus TaxID=36842 RepID=A0A1T5LWS3_9FIRM|nr:protein kinase [Maledivibacter halophilus]SKC80029.1 Protein kinase domain-containing protein [Maledivibacter halophilus]